MSAEPEWRDEDGRLRGVGGKRCGSSRTRAVAGAVLLDLAVSPLFAWNVFTTEFRRQLQASDAELALVFSVGLAAFTAGVLAGGRAADVVAPRRLAFLTTAGTSAGLVGAGIANSLEVLIAAFGIALGASTGLGYATAVSVAATAAQRRGTTLSLVVSAYAAGTVVVAPVAAWLVRETSLPWTFGVLAAGVGTMLIVAALLLPAASPARHSTVGSGTVRIGPVVALWVIFALGSAPALTAFAHAGELMGDRDAGGLSLSVLSAGNLAGRLVAGPASDRVGRHLALNVTAAILVSACGVLAMVDGAGPVLAALLALGLEYGALSALVPAATADVVPRERFGSAYGLVFTAWGAAGLVAPVAAATFAATATWNGVFLAFVGLAGFAWLIISRWGHPSPKPGLSLW